MDAPLASLKNWAQLFSKTHTFLHVIYARYGGNYNAQSYVDHSFLANFSKVLSFGSFTRKRPN